MGWRHEKGEREEVKYITVSGNRNRENEGKKWVERLTGDRKWGKEEKAWGKGGRHEKGEGGS